MTFRHGRFFVFLIYLSCTCFQEATRGCSPITPRSRSGKGKDWAEGDPGMTGELIPGSEVPQAGSRWKETRPPRTVFPAGLHDGQSWEHGTFVGAVGGRAGQKEGTKRSKQGLRPTPRLPPHPGQEQPKCERGNGGRCSHYGHPKKTPVLTDPTVLRSRGQTLNFHLGSQYGTHRKAESYGGPRRGEQTRAELGGGWGLSPRCRLGACLSSYTMCKDP